MTNQHPDPPEQAGTPAGTIGITTSWVAPDSPQHADTDHTDTDAREPETLRERIYRISNSTEQQLSIEKLIKASLRAAEAAEAVVTVDDYRHAGKLFINLATQIAITPTIDQLMAFTMPLPGRKQLPTLIEVFNLYHTAGIRLASRFNQYNEGSE